MMTLRLLEHWRSHLQLDHDSALIVLATAAITMEKFTRVDFEPELKDINSTMPADRLTKCNVSSIASATGLTARRKVRSLLAAGILLRDEEGSVRLSPEYTRGVATSDMLHSLLEALAHSTNDLVRDGILNVGGAAAATPSRE